MDAHACNTYIMFMHIHVIHTCLYTYSRQQLTLHLASVPENFDEEDIIREFERFGEVQSVNICKSRYCALDTFSWLRSL
jgi:hypothetical protein